MRKRTLLRWAVAVVLMTATAFIILLVFKPFSGSQKFLISTGSEGGMYYAFGEVLKEVASKDSELPQFEVLTGNGSKQNVERLESGDCDFAIIQSDAVGGKRVAGVANLYQEVLHLVANTDSSIACLMDLNGKRVSIGPVGSGTQQIVERLLEFVLPDHRTGYTDASLAQKWPNPTT